jgi:hypothetical protein
MSFIEFNFTEGQQERFNLIYAETKKVYPNLVNDDINKERVKVIIAHNVIFGDGEQKEDSNENNVFTE